jgi:hypothetical protein
MLRNEDHEESSSCLSRPSVGVDSVPFMNSSSDWNLNHKNDEKHNGKTPKSMEEKNQEILLSNQPTPYKDYHNDWNDDNDLSPNPLPYATAIKILTPDHLLIEDGDHVISSAFAVVEGMMLMWMVVSMQERET